MNTIHKIGIIFAAFIALFLFSCKSNKTTAQATQTPITETKGQESRTTSTYIDASDEEETLGFVVEYLPLFNGKPAEQEFHNYVNENLQYPQELTDTGITGKVYVQFSIDKDGSVTDAKVIRGLHPLLDAEALRVINSSSSKWTPGKLRGKPVKVMYQFPVNFK